MKNILLTIVLNMVAVSALAVTPLKEKYTHKDFSNELGPNDVMFRVQTIQQYLDWIDLKAVYLSERENGAPGFFLAIPKIAGPHSTPANSVIEEEDQKDAIGYYFKSGTGLTLATPFDNNASARGGTTGGTYTCFKDAKASRAELDVLAFNKDAFKKATTSIDKLNALAIGLRYTPLGDGTGDIQSGCDRRGNIIPVFSPFPADPVQTFAIFRDYEEGDEETRKADGFDVYGPAFGGHFIWEKTDGALTNGQVLIDIYKDLGYEYED